MNIIIQSVHFKAQEPLKEFVQEHMGRLIEYWDQITAVEVTLKVEKDSEHRENKIVEAHVHVPGNDVFAHDRSTTFEAAVDSVSRKLKKQLIKQKEKAYHLH